MSKKINKYVCGKELADYWIIPHLRDTHLIRNQIFAYPYPDDGFVFQQSTSVLVCGPNVEKDENLHLKVFQIYVDAILIPNPP